jgi:hypothetical protein
MTPEERVKREVSRMDAVDVARVLDLIELLKATRRDRSGADETTPGERPYMRARDLLGGCAGSLAEDVSLAREDRV